MNHVSIFSYKEDVEKNLDDLDYKDKLSMDEIEIDSLLKSINALVKQHNETTAISLKEPVVSNFMNPSSRFSTMFSFT